MIYKHDVYMYKVAEIHMPSRYEQVNGTGGEVILFSWVGAECKLRALLSPLILTCNTELQQVAYKSIFMQHTVEIFQSGVFEESKRFRFYFQIPVNLQPIRCLYHYRNNLIQIYYN
jgi:hypothetical protein